MLQPAVHDAAGQAEYAANRITAEAVQPLAAAVAQQVPAPPHTVASLADAPRLRNSALPRKALQSVREECLPN